MGGGGQQQTTKTSSEPWAGVQPYFKNLFSAAQGAFQATPKTPYTGPFYADPNRLQQQALAQTSQLAPQLSAGADSLQRLAQQTASGRFLNVDSNKYLRGAMDAAINPLQQNLQRNILPGISSAAQGAGAYGGSRQALLEGNALEGFNRAAADTRAGMAAQNYANERQLQQNAPAMFSGANALRLAGPQALAAAGDQLYNWDQNKVNEALMKWNELKSAPWNGMGQFAQALGLGQGFSNTVSNTTIPGATPLQQGMQGIMGLPGLISALGGLF